MTERSTVPWPDVERLYHDALGLPAADRAAFLDRACGANVALRAEVESLLRCDTANPHWLDRPALDASVRSLATEPPSLDAGHRLGGYTIESLIGRGGMGQVYRARDLRLDRDVALKVVPHDASAVPDGHRAEEEARAASRLSHPNIVTIYGVGDDGDRAFIAMELVPGRTLRAMLADGPIASALAIDLGAQLADALATAHENGIVHRDLKPDNLMVTPDGVLKILDFGIAHRSWRPRDDAARAAADERHVIAGTVGYMSPEQASGGLVDYRTDQFALAAILCELLSGRPAVAVKADASGTPRADTTAGTELPAVVPAALRPILTRCLAPSAGDRYERTRDLADDLARLREEQRRAAAGVGRRRVLWWMSGAAAAGATAAWSLWPAVHAPRSMAVLPFATDAGDPDVEYLGTGIADSLARRLAFVPDLDVRVRSAAASVGRHSAADAAATGRTLRVDAVLTGQVRRQDTRIVVRADLVDVAGGTTIWSADYARPASDLLTLQHDLATAIVDEGIRRPLRGPARQRFDRELSEDAEAHDLYLRGLHLHRLGDERSRLAARRALTEAVARDPTFAVAHVSLASTFTVMVVDGLERPTDGWPQANRSVRHALDIDPDLPEAHAEQAAFWFYFDRDWDAAERAWTRALNSGTSPTLPDLNHSAAIMLWALGRDEDALEQARRARALDPLTPRFGVLEADLLLSAGRADEADHHYRGLLAGDPDDVGAWLGFAESCRARGHFDAAIDARRRAYGQMAVDWPPAFREVLARARGEDGDRGIRQAAAAMELEGLDQRASRHAYVSPLDRARAYAQLGNRTRAFGHLDDAFEHRSPGLVFLNVDRAWDEVRDDRRFTAAVEAVGLV